MRNIMALVLCLSLLTVSSVSVLAYGNDGYYGEGQATIKARQYSTFMVNIPETINAENYEDNQISVTEADLETGYAINIYVTNLNGNNGITLYNDEDNTKTARFLVSNCDTGNQLVLRENYNLLASFKDTEIDNESASASKNFIGSIQTADKAGTYTGVMNYEIRCERY